MHFPPRPKLTRNGAVAPVCSMPVCHRVQAQTQPKSSCLWWLKQCHEVRQHCWGGCALVALRWQPRPAHCWQPSCTEHCGCDRRVQLLLGFCFHPSDCAFHSSVIKADGCLQSPRQMDRWALLSSELRARLCWPCLFSWQESVKKLFCSFSSCFHLKQIWTNANLRFPHLPADATPG